MQGIDFYVTDSGSFYTVTAISEEAEQWRDENLLHSENQWMKNAAYIPVEHRYIADIVWAMEEDGFTVDGWRC